VIVATLLSVLATGVLLVVLGLHDPKRLRNVRQSVRHDIRDDTDQVHGAGIRAPLPASLRRLLAWLTLAPGVVLMVLGAWWAFVVWLGAFGAIGWTIAQLLPGKSSPADTPAV
jgi:hypothetical protein